MKLLNFIIGCIFSASCLTSLPTTIATASASTTKASIVAFSASCLLSLPTGATASTKATKAKASPNKIKESSNKIGEYLLGPVSCPGHCTSGANYGGILFANNVEECNPEDKNQRWITHRVHDGGEIIKLESPVNAGRCLGVAAHGGDTGSAVSGVEYYIRNSWTTSWGEEDYVRIGTETLHTPGGVTALMAAKILGPRIGRRPADSISSGASEAALAGESVPIDNIPVDAGIDNPEQIPLGDRKNMAYSDAIAAGLEIGLAAIAPGRLRQGNAAGQAVEGGYAYASYPPLSAEGIFNVQLALVDCQDPGANWLLTGAQLFSAALWSEGHSAAMAVNEDCTSLELSLAENGVPNPLTRAESFMFLESSFIQGIAPAQSEEEPNEGENTGGLTAEQPLNIDPNVGGFGASEGEGEGEGEGEQVQIIVLDLSLRGSNSDSKTTVDVPTAPLIIDAEEYKSIQLIYIDPRTLQGVEDNLGLGQNVRGVIFFLDSNDANSIAEAKNKLTPLLEAGLPFLFVAENQDSPGAIRIPAIEDELGLSTLSNYAGLWQITNDLSQEALQWFAEEIAAPLLVSDIRLKHNIKLIGESPDGIPIFSFQYRDGIKLADNKALDTKSTFVGVMAQDLLELAPHAVIKNEEDGYYRVDYSKIDVDFGKL